jgi:hypothetical protein
MFEVKYMYQTFTYLFLSKKEGLNKQAKRYLNPNFEVINFILVYISLLYVLYNSSELDFAG